MRSAMGFPFPPRSNPATSLLGVLMLRRRVPQRYRLDPRHFLGARGERPPGQTRRNSPLVEDRPLGAGALEFVEARVGGDRDDAVEEFARLFTLGRGGDDGAEEGDTADRDDGGADVLAHPADRRGVGGARGVVELVGVEVLDEVGGQAHLGEGFREHLREVRAAPGVEAGADRVVERLDVLDTVLLPGGVDHPRRAPRPVDRGAVAGVEVAALVENGEAHDVPRDVDVTDLLYLGDPPGGHPRPRAGGVEPKIYWGCHCSPNAPGCIAEIVLRQSYAASMRNNGAPLSISVPGSATRATCVAPRATTGTTGLRAPISSICHSTMISPSRTACPALTRTVKGAPLRVTVSSPRWTRAAPAPVSTANACGCNAPTVPVRGLTTSIRPVLGTGSIASPGPTIASANTGSGRSARARTRPARGACTRRPGSDSAIIRPAVRRRAPRRGS